MRVTVLSFLLIVAGSMSLLGQTTSFTYQGRLLQNSLPPTANYDLEFKLFDAASGGTELGSIARPNVAVNGGVFTVTLDFGAQFDGSPRFLEISVKSAGTPDPATVLTPRQPISSTPYAIRSLDADHADTAQSAVNAQTAATASTAVNSTQLGGISAGNYVLTTDSRLTDSRSPTSGSSFYIQNRTTTQSGANFDIGGTGEADIFSADTQFNIGVNRILSSPGTLNTFVGINNGTSLQNGTANTFVGRNTGPNNTTGFNNTFVGVGAGFENINGSNNAFFGLNAGLRVTSGSQNSIFGVSGGGRILTTNNNSIFGFEAGLNATNHDNSFFGSLAGRSTTSGGSNAFFGKSAGENNTTGFNNTFIGSNTGSSIFEGSNNTLIGAGTNVSSNDPGFQFSTAVGAGTVVSRPNAVYLGRDDLDRVFIGRLDTGASVSLCATGFLGGDPLGTHGLSQCSSSLRYKDNVANFTRSFEIFEKLRPVTFNWKEGGMRDLGLVAEEVEAIDPLLVTYNYDGLVEGVKYDRIGVVLINVVKEQQAQIESQSAENKELKTTVKALKDKLDEQQRQLEALRLLVCSERPDAKICVTGKEALSNEK